MRKETFHTLRQWAGHATEALQQRYTHLDADAADAIGKFW